MMLMARHCAGKTKLTWIGEKNWFKCGQTIDVKLRISKIGWPSTSSRIDLAKRLLCRMSPVVRPPHYGHAKRIVQLFWLGGGTSDQF